MSLEQRELPAGTMVWIQGFPVRLTAAVVAESHNFALIDQFEAVRKAGYESGLAQARASYGIGQP